MIRLQNMSSEVDLQELFMVCSCARVQTCTLLSQEEFP